MVKSRLAGVRTTQARDTINLSPVCVTSDKEGTWLFWRGETHHNHVLLGQVSEATHGWSLSFVLVTHHYRIYRFMVTGKMIELSMCNCICPRR